MSVISVSIGKLYRAWALFITTGVHGKKKESLTEVLTSENSCRIFSLRQDIRVVFSVASYIFR
jgi:hypothetical protein